MVLDLVGDDNEEMKKRKNIMVWDRKKKKFVKGGENKTRKTKNEAGAVISGRNTKKNELYKTWLEKKKIKHADSDEDEDDGDQNKNKHLQHNRSSKSFTNNRERKTFKNDKRKFSKQTVPSLKQRSELKRKEQIIKNRQSAQKKQTFQKARREKRTKRNRK
ncbi:hypothetical protein HELRODRAFT_190306 [Helobdella robusta]|uniref:DBP10 C-terminal domain-containing protein n=1 Tax=Helobdella robusta TaxID=6412 RepID=T1FRV9_HELRO|nr:hypothetical protein HELRODRAFT_190306 [Helobdella robusta]ESO09857.1 hypothetical protein HELRODRAFT_190306 [Helobdella robusta]